MTVTIIFTSYLLIGAIICWKSQVLLEKMTEEMFETYPDLLEFRGILVAIFAIILIVLAPIASLLDVKDALISKIRSIKSKRRT